MNKKNSNKLSFKKDSLYKYGYGIVAKKVMRDKRLTSEAKAIYAYICSFAGSGNTSFPSAQLIMDELNLGEKRFYKHRKILIDYGYITIIKNRKGNRRDNNTYFINQYGSFERVQTETVQIETVQNRGTNINSININSINNNSIYTKQFLDWYNLYPNPFNKQQSFKNFKKLLKEEKFENIMQATKNYIKYLKQNNVDKQYVVRSTNFIGQKKEYAGYLEMDFKDCKKQDTMQDTMPNAGAYKLV